MISASKPMLNKSGKSGHSCLVPSPRVNAFSISSLRMKLAIVFSGQIIICNARLVNSVSLKNVNDTMLI